MGLDIRWIARNENNTSESSRLTNRVGLWFGWSVEYSPTEDPMTTKRLQERNPERSRSLGFWEWPRTIRGMGWNDEITE